MVIFTPLFFTAFSLAFIHTVLGPDHYLPFVALSQSNKWSYKKTMVVSMICGLAHCLSSVVIGLIGIALGVALGHLESIEGMRGDIASYLMIAFGTVYLVWSVKKLVKGEDHVHANIHTHDGQVHHHSRGMHTHTHKKVNSNLFWGIFIVFLFGPCEPLIPLLMYPAAQMDLIQCVVVAGVFTFVTVATMLTVITLAIKGISFVRVEGLQKYAHTMASVTIILCGVAIVLGL